MVQTRAIILGAFAALLLAVPAKAQVLVDVSKISCDQYITQRITHMQTVNVWLAGFYAGRRNNPAHPTPPRNPETFGPRGSRPAPRKNPVVNTKALKKTGKKLSPFC